MTVPICYSSMYLFADDTKLVKSICSEVDQQHLQEDIQELSIWCQKWKMSLNISKCLAIKFSLHPCQSSSYQIGNMEVKSTTSHRETWVSTLPILFHGQTTVTQYYTKKPTDLCIYYAEQFQTVTFPEPKDDYMI